jgi:hypothetical protein
MFRIEKNICRVLIAAFVLSTLSSISQVKSIVYDFDGLDIGQTNIPEGDYSYGDLTYKIAANPIAAGEMLGDRVMQLDLKWNLNYATFGRGISRYIEFDANEDVLNFYFYNPPSNSQNAVFDVNIGDDDNQSNTFESVNDDVWKKSLTISPSPAWQLISIPLKDFSDSNAGGNGIFDISFSQNKGMLCQVEFRFSKPGSVTSDPSFYIDMINFSDGVLPRGATVFDLPAKNPSDYCLLGAFIAEQEGGNYLIPSQFESFFPPDPSKKIKYVNFFQQWANGGTSPNQMPASSIQTLLTEGYVPIITWEPMFTGYDRLDPVQPRLDNIINGTYDNYLDNYADKIKLFSDTVIIRLMHEFEGDWYSWSISQNGGDPQKYIAAYRRIVDRFRARGVTNVLWMWCTNSDYAPVRSYNWVVAAYPGDSYVNIVATDIYNNHSPIDLPWWKSFKWQATESYYYLSKYIPNKPLFICELGCRERKDTENAGSETKANWFARMDKELQSNFHNARALIFFNAFHEQNWPINTSQASIQSLTDNIWNDDYYFKIQSTSVKENHQYGEGLYIYPNPFTGLVNIYYTSKSLIEEFTIDITDESGKRVYAGSFENKAIYFQRTIDLSDHPKGIYYARIEATIPDGANKVYISESAKLILE